MLLDSYLGINFVPREVRAVVTGVPQEIIRVIRGVS